MLMVLNLHSFDGFNQGHGFWQAFDFFRESTSICAVDCFLMISGYFGIKWKLKSFFNLIFQIFYYSIGIYLVVVALGIVDWNLREFLIRFACLFAKSWGFVVGYVILYFLAPIFNVFTDKTSTRALGQYIFILFLATNFICLSQESVLVFTYSLMYLIGRFLRKINIKDSCIPAGKLYVLITLTIFVLVYFVIFKLLHQHNAVSLFVGFIGYRYSAPLVILQAAFLLIYFSKLEFNSKIINWGAASCFSIFLIHMHPTIKEIGYLSYTRSLYNQPVLYHIIALTFLIVTVFCMSIIIDKLRICISNSCYTLFTKSRNYIPQKWLRFDGYSLMLERIAHNRKIESEID